MISTDDIVIRLSDWNDTAALDRLAQLDSKRLPAGSFLIAEAAGAMRAALALSSGVAIADPFYPSAALVSLLEAHPARAAHLHGRKAQLPERLGRALPRAALARTH